MRIQFVLLSVAMLQVSGVNAEATRSAQDMVTQKCALCHGENGEGNSTYPRLAGQNSDYMIKQLADFKNGRREGTMNEMAADLTQEEMAALANYFEAMPVLSHKVRDKNFAAVGYYIYHNGNEYSGVPACASCHGDDGTGTAKLPRLAGQHKHYLSWQLQDFNRRKRTNDNAIMHSVASKLTEFEIAALALYISGM